MTAVALADHQYHKCKCVYCAIASKIIYLHKNKNNKYIR